MSDATGKLTRWRLRLSELELDVVHRARVKHYAVDALSRLPTSGADETMIDGKTTLLLLKSTQTTALQGDNPT